MALLLRDKQITQDNWLVVDETATTLPSGDILLSFNHWQQLENKLEQHNGAIGVWIEGNAEIEDFLEPLLSLPLIAINFPKFADGRGFSLATLLRDRYQYKGELRAIGNFIRDQLFFLTRCGFNSFNFPDGTNLEEVANSLTDFSENYQVSADENQPLFRRR